MLPAIFAVSLLAHAVVNAPLSRTAAAAPPAASAAASATATAGPSPGTPAAAVFEKLRALAGDWSGTYEWSGGRSGGGAIEVKYAVVARNSVVIETLIQGGEPTMTSVYHLDGADLRMTHYCAAQNQPRLKASRIDAAHGEIDFAFVDVTNLASPTAGHVHGAEIRMPDADHLTIVFLFLAGKNESRERLELRRAGAAAS
ncbi:MAG TPA: hypothetical protein VGS03_09855 [Candidatus Polarisedimenticolia bacterium]|nr:hypothetical protein [Candidatus Polarisedimenticolia bacterium]